MKEEVYARVLKSGKARRYFVRIGHPSMFYRNGSDDDQQTSSILWYDSENTRESVREFLINRRLPTDYRGNETSSILGPFASWQKAYNAQPKHLR